LRGNWPEVFSRLPRDAEHQSDPKPLERIAFALGGQDLRLNELDYETTVDAIVRFWEETEEARWNERQKRKMASTETS
jgi:hypothetical protein